MYRCPVCAYPALPDPPRDFEICPSCGTEFGYHDARRTHKELRNMWIKNGLHWHSRSVPKPIGWNGLRQIGLEIEGLAQTEPRISPASSKPNTMTFNFHGANVLRVA